jgi:hypothetical protein
VDRQLVLQLSDPLARGDQLGMVAASHAGDLAAVDQLLPPPGVDHLGADVQVIGDLRDWPASGHQIQDLPPELRRVPLGHNTLLGLPDE